jgi:hypothetical protein
LSIASTSVVLPWSTCAIMAIFRIFLLMISSSVSRLAQAVPAKTKIAAETTSSPDESPLVLRCGRAALV